MKIFIDTADIREIKEANAMGILDGVTTNPTLIARTGRPFMRRWNCATAQIFCSVSNAHWRTRNWPATPAANKGRWRTPN